MNGQLTYAPDGCNVLHHIKVSPDPKRLNTTETRLTSFRGDDLVLTAATVMACLEMAINLSAQVENCKINPRVSYKGCSI